MKKAPIWTNCIDLRQTCTYVEHKKQKGFGQKR